MQLAWIIPAGSADGARPDNSLPGGPPLYPAHGLPAPMPPVPTYPIVLPPGQGWPPMVNPPIVPPDAPPGSIWPPLPPLQPGESTKAVVLIAIPGHGYRYAVVDLAPRPAPKA